MKSFLVEVHPYMTSFLHFLAKYFFCNFRNDIGGSLLQCVRVTLLTVEDTILQSRRQMHEVHVHVVSCILRVHYLAPYYIATG